MRVILANLFESGRVLIRMANFLEDYLGFKIQVFDPDQVKSSGGLNFLRLSVDGGSVDALVKTDWANRKLAKYLSPAECLLFDENSGEYNSSRVKEAPHVPNGLRVAIQSIDYVADAGQARIVAKNIKTMLGETLQVRSKFAYFLAYGKYFCYASESTNSAFHLDLDSADVRLRSSYASQYLIPIEIGRLCNHSVLDKLVAKIDQSPNLACASDGSVYKQGMYDCARVAPPTPIDPKMLLRCKSILFAPSSHSSGFFEESGRPVVPMHEGIESGCFGGPLRFKRGSYNVIL